METSFFKKQHNTCTTPLHGLHPQLQCVQSMVTLLKLKGKENVHYSKNTGQSESISITSEAKAALPPPSAAVMAATKPFTNAVSCSSS